MATVHLYPLTTPSLKIGAVAALAPAGPLVDAGFAALARAAGQADAPLPAALQLAGTGPVAEGTGGAMQLDQAVLARQVAWPAPDARALAASWRVTVKAYGQQVAALEQQARRQLVPAALFMAAQAQGQEQPERQLPPPMVNSEAWRFLSYGWGGRQMTLRVLAGSGDPPPGRRRRGKLALRLELVLADGSPVVVQLEPLTDGILLDLAARGAAATQQLRAALPALGEAVARIGLRILRCSVRDTLQPGPPQRHDPAAAAALGLPVFRALAEVALLLSRPAAGAA